MRLPLTYKANSGISNFVDIKACVWMSVGQESSVSSKCQPSIIIQCIRTATKLRAVHVSRYNQAGLRKEGRSSTFSLAAPAPTSAGLQELSSQLC